MPRYLLAQRPRAFDRIDAIDPATAAVCFKPCQLAQLDAGETVQLANGERVTDMLAAARLLALCNATAA